jgi:hypothetical protein
MAKTEKTEILISKTDQFIIDAICIIRLNLDLSQKILSGRISDADNISIVSHAESIKTSHKYTDADLHKIAHIFTEEAQKIKDQLTTEQSADFQTDYTIHDFYPNEPLPDVLVIKSKNVMISKVYPTGAVRCLLEDSDFFGIPRTNKEVTEEANRLFEKSWKTTDFGSPLDRAVVKGDLVKTEPPAVVTYQKAK